MYIYVYTGVCVCAHVFLDITYFLILVTISFLWSISVII